MDVTPICYVTVRLEGVAVTALPTREFSVFVLLSGVHSAVVPTGNSCVVTEGDLISRAFRVTAGERRSQGLECFRSAMCHLGH